MFIQPVDLDDRRQVRQFLELCDLVKFARFKVGQA